MILQAQQTHYGELDRALQEKFYQVFEPEMLTSVSRPEPSAGNLPPQRCLTPLFREFEQNREHLSGSVRRQLEAYRTTACTRPATTGSYTSESGRFVIHYDTEGVNSVPGEDLNGNGIPDFIEQTAFAADSSWNHLIGTLGFVDPIPESVGPYEIYYQNFNFYGLTCSDGATSFMILNNDFDGFPENDHPEGSRTGALYATTAHEFKHASQYATNRWREEEGSGSSMLWIEMDAVMIEEIVFDDVNDYHHYLRTGSGSPHPSSIFANPSVPVPGGYHHVTWMLYFAEKLGMEFWVDVWSRFKLQSTKPFVQAVRESLELYQTTFAAEHTENLSWHVVTGPFFSAPDFGFREQEFYPTSRFQSEINILPDSTVSAFLQPLAGHFIRLRSEGSLLGSPKVTVSHDVDGIGLGLIGYFRDGSVQYNNVSGQTGTSGIQTTWRWEELDKVAIAVVNTTEEHSIEFQLSVESVLPEEIALFQNYPNPFRHSTRIRFALDKEEVVRLELFDILGRRVKTLAERSFTRGFHTLDLDAADLASGVYIYRMTAGENTQLRKMVRIR